MVYIVNATACVWDLPSTDEEERASCMDESVSLQLDVLLNIKTDFESAECGTVKVRFVAYRMTAAQNGLWQVCCLVDREF